MKSDRARMDIAAVISRSFRRALRLGILLSAALLVTTGATAHEDEATLAGHSFHGEAYDEGPRQAAYLMEGMPKIEFPVTTTNTLAQKFFNQGVGQLHGFWYFEAERSFRQVAMLDTNCLMASWGVAMANVYNEKRAREFTKQAVARTNTVTISRRELLYIESLAKFYPEDKPKDAPKEDEVKRHRDYVRSLEQIIEEFPGDIEAKAFLAFKIWDNGGRVSISSHMAVDALAQQVLAVNPTHPVQHARIHLWNDEADRRALDAAALCGQGSPGIAHMWHMPGHPYSALHRYADGAWQQEASARVDHAYMIRNRVLPDQIHNFAHNNEWLVNNLNYVGRVRDAVELANNMVELPRHPKYNSITKDSGTNGTIALADTSSSANKNRHNSAVFGRTRLLETLVRWELWDELLTLGNSMYLDPTDLPEEQSKRLRALALAHFAKGETNAGSMKITELETVLKAQRELRHAEEDEAEAKAREAKQSEEQVAKAMTEAMGKHAERIKMTEASLTELRFLALLAKGALEEARQQTNEIKDFPKDRLSRIWLQLGDKDKAVTLAREFLDGATNQVLALANYTDILERSGKHDDAVKTFEQLRSISPQADLDTPVMQRLNPLAAQLKLPDDWRPAYQPSTDVGQRPSLDSLGPFRWRPSPALDWKLPDENGKIISLTNYHGRPVLVVFYLGYRCKHCLEQLNAFAPMTKRFQDAGISIVAISTDSAAGLRKTFNDGKDPGGFPFPVVSDESLESFKKYRSFDDFENAPLHGTFLVDADGLVRWQDIGYDPFMQLDFLLAESQRLLKLPSKPIRVTSIEQTAPIPVKDSKHSVSSR